MTIMMDDDEDSDRLFIDEEPPASPRRQKTGHDSTDTTPVSHKKTSELRNVRKNSAELPHVNYLPLMRNHTLATIQNNILNTSGKQRITVKDFARIPDASSNETNDSALYALLTENSASFLAGMNAAVQMDNNALRTEIQNNDPRVAEIWLPTSTGYKAIPTDQREPTGHTIHNYVNTPHDLSGPRIPANAYGDRLGIPPKGNAYGGENGNILPHTPSAHMNDKQASMIAPNGNGYGGQNENILPHTPSAHMNARQASVLVPNSANLSGGTMSYPPSHWQVQDGQTQYMNGYNRSHNSPPEHQARVNYQRTQALMNCPPGYSYSRPAIPAHPSNHHHCNPRPPPPPYMYAVGMTCNCQRLASANPHVMPAANPHNVPCNGYRPYSTNSIPHVPYGRDTAAYLAEMRKHASLQRNSYRIETMRTETTHAVISGHANQKPGAKTTNKRAYTKISKNNTQVVMNTSEIPASYNAIANAAVNIPNSDPIENEETTAKKKVARPNTNTSKVNATISVNNQVHAPSNIEIRTRNNIEIPSIDLTSECTQPSMDDILNVIQPPLNTDTHLPPTTMRNNASANITTVSHYIDIADEIQVPINKEGSFNSIPMHINNDNGTPELIEAQKGTINMNANREQPLMNTELAVINHNRDEIPLIMDQKADSAFIQLPHNNINRQDASTLLDNDNDRTKTDVTTRPITLTQSSSNAYGITTKKISHNIEKNEVLRCKTVNTETDCLLDVQRTSSILNTVDYRTETRVTTVEVLSEIVNQIKTTISEETLKDILNKVRQTPAKTAAIVDQAHDNQVNTCEDTVNYNADTNKIIAHTITGDYIEARIDHKPQEIVSKHNEELEIARKNLAKLRAIEHRNEDSSCKRVENFAQKDNENPYQIKIAIGQNGEYIAQVISVSNDGSFVEEKHIQINSSTSNTEQISTSYTENISHSQRKQETEVLEGKQCIENNQEINEAIETRESIRNETCNESNAGSIDETLFFKFQINFFRLVQERLSENNCQELAAELSKDIYDLIAISDDEGAKADMKYKCHMCRNIAVYSPRSFYYNVTKRQENSLDKVQKCPLCITFKKKYVDILIKYIEIEAPKERTHNKKNKNVVQRNVAIVDSTDVRQFESENSIHNVEYSKDNSQKEYYDIENQLSLITNGVPSSPKRIKIDDQAKPNAEHVLDVSKTTEDSKTNDFVVKLPRNRLKESTVKALMQNSKSYPKKTDTAEATLNITIDNNSDKVNIHSENREQRKNINTEIATSKIAEKHNRNVNKSTNMSVSDRGLEVEVDAAINRIYRNSIINEENPRKIVKSISARDPTDTNTEEQNKDTISASDNIERNDKNQKTPRKIWRSISATSTSNMKLQQVYYNKDPQTNIISKSSHTNADTVRNKENHTKKRASISDEAVTGINLEPKLRSANVIVSDGKQNKSQEKLRKVMKSISVETACNSDHTKNQGQHRIQKSVSAETISITTSKNTVSSSNSSDVNNQNEENREGRKSISDDITNIDRPNVTTNTPNNTNNDNTLVRSRELSDTIRTETTNISRTTTNTEINKNESATTRQVTAAVTEKDDTSRSHEKQVNNEKIRNDDANDGKKVTSENQEESSDKANQTVNKALDDCLKTLKANCNSKEELPQVETGKKENKNTKSKEHKPFEEIKKKKTKLQPEINYQFRCKVCTVIFKYHAACINHMKNNHNIQNPVIPLDYIYNECAFCELYIMVNLYNTHIRTVHSDKFSEQRE